MNLSTPASPYKNLTLGILVSLAVCFITGCTLEEKERAARQSTSREICYNVVPSPFSNVVDQYCLKYMGHSR